ncbi:MAG: DivIVA domain-containing protein [Acutalibacteraceae bacterium]
MLRTEQILNAKFTPVSKGTYSAEEVDAFLKGVAESYDESLNENKELIKKISILADKIESYRNDEEAIKLSLLDAHRMAETIGKNAEIKAETTVSDAESRAKIILDGANRQSTQMIDEAREKAKEIVDNARNAVASLTERAQKETEQAIVSAQKKAQEIIADARDKGEKIIGNSKESYEFYSAELEKVQAKTASFKAAVEELCKGQLSLLYGVPSEFFAAISSVAAAAESNEDNTPVAEPEAVAEQTVIEEAPVIDEAPVVTAEPEIEPVVQAEVEEEPEAVEPVEEAEANIVYSPEDSAQQPAAEEKSDEEVDDLFSFIEDLNLDTLASSDSISASIDDLLPTPPAVEEKVEDKAEEENLEDFGGFKVDLDDIDGIAESNNDDDGDDDITSLFDSMFDE